MSKTSRSELDAAVANAKEALRIFAAAISDLAEQLRKAFAWLEIPRSRKNRARREKGRRLAKERRARRSRPVPAPPGGYIWIRHKKRTRHLARGEGQ